MLNVEILKQIVNDIGYDLVIQIFPPEDKDIRACVDKEDKIIYVDAANDPATIVQDIIHECIHAVDPECTNLQDDPEIIRACELRAELGAQLFMGKDYQDDGYIADVTNHNFDLYFQCKDEAKALLLEVVG